MKWVDIIFKWILVAVVLWDLHMCLEISGVTKEQKVSCYSIFVIFILMHNHCPDIQLECLVRWLIL